MTYTNQQNVAIQAVTLSASTADVAFTPTSFLYTVDGNLHYGSSLSSPVDLDPAFAASTQYYRGDMIVQAGNIYQAKNDFVSGAAFSANDWFLLDANTVTTGNVRMYVFFARYNPTTGATSIVVRCGKQTADTFNSLNGTSLTATVGNVNQDIGQAELSLRVSEDKNTVSMAKIGFMLARNQSGSDFVPGTTALSAIYTYFFSALSYNND